METRGPVPDIWWKWLLAASLATVVVGAAFVCAAGSVLQPMVRFYYEQFSPTLEFDTLSAEAVAYQTWLYGVLGGVMVGWGVALVPLVYYPFRRGERWAWGAIAASMLCWFVFDTGASAAHGVMANVILNCVFLVAFGVPLVGAARHFPRQART